MDGRVKQAAFSLAGVVAIAMSFVVSVSAFASPSPTVIKPNKFTPPLSSGALQGGQAAEEFSLLGVQMKASGTAERMILVYGDRAGQALKGQPGFFNVALDHDGKRLVIDLAQVTRTAIDPTQLRKALAASHLVASSEMTMDPQDNSTNITLMLKQPVQISVATETASGQGAQSKVLFDMRPAVDAKGAAK